MYSPAQEMLKGGDMEDESAWTITDVSIAQPGFDPEPLLSITQMINQKVGRRLFKHCRIWCNPQFYLSKSDTDKRP